MEGGRRGGDKGRNYEVYQSQRELGPHPGLLPVRLSHSPSRLPVFRV